MTNSLLSVLFSLGDQRRLGVAPALKGPRGLDLESVLDKHTRNKSISFSVVTVVDIIKAPSADTSKSKTAAAKWNCTNLLDSEWFVLVLREWSPAGSRVALSARLELDISH